MKIWNAKLNHLCGMLILFGITNFLSGCNTTSSTSPVTTPQLSVSTEPSPSAIAIGVGSTLGFTIPRTSIPAGIGTITVTLNSTNPGSVTIPTTCTITYASWVVVGGSCSSVTAIGAKAGTTTILATAPSFASAITTAITTVSVTYAYVSDSSPNLWQCAMTENGTIVNNICTPLENNNGGFNSTNCADFESFDQPYIYVCDVNTAIPVLWQCPMTESGIIGNNSRCNGLSGGFGPVAGTTFATFNDQRYAYVSDQSANLWQCSMTATGTIGNNSQCTRLVNSSSGGFAATYGVTFASFADTTYAYVSDNESNVMWQCPMTANGAIASGGCNGLLNSNTTINATGFNPYIGGITFESFAGVTYAYVSDNANVWRCQMTANGTIANNGYCDALVDSNGYILAPVAVTFESFAGTNYAYVSEDTGGQVIQCPLTESGAFADGGCNAFSPGFNYIAGITFYTP